MGFLELLLLAIGLSMDAFAVSVCKGLAMPRADFREQAICGAWFGGFQALMPFAGYLLGSRFEQYIETVSAWVAFVLLAAIGLNMLREALSKEEEHASAGVDFKTMLVMAVATSIDALAVGITFACVPLRLIAASALLNTLLGIHGYREYAILFQLNLLLASREQFGNENLLFSDLEEIESMTRDTYLKLASLLGKVEHDEHHLIILLAKEGKIGTWIKAL